MQTEVALRISVLPFLVLLLLYWGAVLLFFRVRAKRSAETIVNGAARVARPAGATSFEVGIPIPLGRLFGALLLPLLLLGILALIQ